MNPQVEPCDTTTASPFQVSEPPNGSNPDPFMDLVGGAPSSPAPVPPQHDIVPFAPAGDFINFYGLKENPFADSVHPAFYFRTDSHGEAFRSMMLGVDFQASLGMVTGPSGMGKTLVTQLLLQHFEEPKHRVILVLVTPGLGKTGLLREILSELNLPLPVGITRVQDLVKLLSNHIIELHQQGQRLVIIIDECHLLSADCLHVIRTISNIETPEQKLTTCLLFGESRLAQRLDHPSYESLRNRIYMRCELRPLSPDEVTQYVKFRLMTAGRMKELFTEDAVKALGKYSGGICRTLNKLAMLSLIDGADRHVALIDEATVNAAAKHL